MEQVIVKEINKALKNKKNYYITPEPIKPDSLMLWPSGAPNAFEIPGPESGFITFRTKEYETAYLEVYPARNPNGLCVIMCPRGAAFRCSAGYAYHAF